MLGQLFFQGRQRRLRLREGRFLSHHISLGNLTEPILLPEKFQSAGLDLYNPLYGSDLPPQARFLDRPGNHVRRKRKIRSPELKTLKVFLRLQGFQLPSQAPEYVECVSHGDLGRVEAVEIAVRCERTGEGVGDLLAGGVKAGRNAGEEGAPLGIDVLLRYPQRCLGGLEVGVCLDGPLDQVVERFRVEERPPLGGDIDTSDEGLSFSALDLG